MNLQSATAALALSCLGASQARINEPNPAIAIQTPASRPTSESLADPSPFNRILELNSVASLSSSSSPTEAPSAAREENSFLNFNVDTVTHTSELGVGLGAIAGVSVAGAIALALVNRRLHRGDNAVAVGVPVNPTSNPTPTPNTGNTDDSPGDVEMTQQSSTLPIVNEVTVVDEEPNRSLSDTPVKDLPVVSPESVAPNLPEATHVAPLPSVNAPPSAEVTVVLAPGTKFVSLVGSSNSANPADAIESAS